MSTVEDPRNINGIVLPPMRRFSTLGPWPSGFINKPLMNGYGTYSVYPVFIPTSYESSRYKMYILVLDITNMPADSLTQNDLPDPKIATKMFILNAGSNFDSTIWYNLTTTVGGNTFVFRNQTGSQTIVNSRISFCLFGY
jgi:hypothetical protein